MFTLAIANQKGGVAKTTTAANLADAAAERGARTLLVDLDVQANATALTDAAPRTGTDAVGRTRPLSISDALAGTQKDAIDAVQRGLAYEVDVPAGEHWSPQLRVAPASRDLANRNVEVFPGALERLAQALRPSVSHEPVDLVVIDCGPSLGALFLNAMHAADAVLVAAEPADNALEAIPATLDVMRQVAAQRSDRRPALLGVLPTAVAREARPTELLEVLRSYYEEQVLEPVPRRAVVRQAEGAHAPVRAFGASGREVADVYDRLAAHVLRVARVLPTSADHRGSATTERAS